ncbi:MAG TPA: hypothetical protein VGH20_06795 [Myxococcales bacterium]|jgi:hypothetical protein
MQDHVVPLPEAALALENRAIGRGGEPTLGSACDLLIEQWCAGVRDRELGLHLAFLAWYILVEPPFLTGADEARVAPESLAGVFREVHDFLAPLESRDAELLYVFGLMAHLFPWVVGDVKEWETRSAEYRTAYRKLAPDGVRPDVFEGRGFYGHYFRGQAAVKGGY